MAWFSEDVASSRITTLLSPEKYRYVKDELVSSKAQSNCIQFGHFDNALLHDSTYIVDPWWYKWFVALPRSSQVRRKWCCSPIQQGTFRQSPGDCSSSSTRKSWRRMLCPRGQNWTAACHEKGHGPGDRRMHGSFTQFLFWKRTCGMHVSLFLWRDKSDWKISELSIMTEPSTHSTIRYSSNDMDDFPAPVRPTIPTLNWRNVRTPICALCDWFILPFPLAW